MFEDTDTHRASANWRAEILSKLYWLLLLKLGVIIALFGVVFIFLKDYPLLFNLLILYGVVMLGYLGALLFWQRIQEEVSLKFLYTIEILFELIIESAIVAYSGGAASPFTVLFSFTILSSAFFYELPGTILTATISVFCYLAVIYLQLRGLLYLPPTNPIAKVIYEEEDALYTAAYLQVAFMYIVAFISGYLSQKVKIHLSALSKVHEQLSQIKWDTDQILQHMESGLLTIDSEGNVVYLNKAASNILGIVSENVSTRHFSEVIPDRCAGIRELLEKALLGAFAAYRSEVSIVNHKGNRIPIAAVVNTLSIDEQVRGVILLFEDITEQKRQEKLIKDMEKLAAVGELSARIAHELRNPLAAIRGGIEMIERQIRKARPDQRVIDLVKKETDRITQVLEEFLTFARIKELPQEQFVSERTDLSSEVASSLENFRMAGKLKGITIVNRLMEPIWVKGRKDYLRQVIDNIISNAIDAISVKGDGTITIEMAGTTYDPVNQQSLLGITIQDDGCGMSAEVLSSIFDPFFTTKLKGVGLGLAIVKGIVSQSMGTIEVESKQGAGAKFVVRLPAAK